jgi:polysaccharide biosynthesis/export protein
MSRSYRIAFEIKKQLLDQALHVFRQFDSCVIAGQKKVFACGLGIMMTGSALAQDPGVRDYDMERRARQQQSGSVSTGNSGPVIKSAGVINSMADLDDSRPIQSGDTISIRVVEDRGEPLQMIVGVTGQVNAPHIGLVKAVGRTCRELGYEIKRRLELSYYNSATVIVAIDQERQDSGRPNRVIDMEFFTVYGQVIRQGKYEMPNDEDITISQAILRSGGFAQFANVRKVKLIRKTPQGAKTIIINLDRIMRKGRLEYDVYLRNNDVIIVDEKKINV